MRLALRKHVWLLLLCISLTLPASFAAAQAPSAPAEQRKTSTPYTGDLSIFDTPGRDQRLQINRVMEVLAIAPGKKVADIGAGSGWFTVRAARKVAPSGLVYAVDINPEATRYIEQRAGKEHLADVKTIHSQPNNPQLAPGSVDAVLMLKSYHEFAQPIVLLRNLRPALRPGARVGIIDRDGNGEDHGVNKDIVLQEARAAGYRLLSEHDDLVKGDKMDYFLVLTVK